MNLTIFKPKNILLSYSFSEQNLLTTFELKKLEALMKNSDEPTAKKYELQIVDPKTKETIKLPNCKRQPL